MGVIPTKLTPEKQEQLKLANTAWKHCSFCKGHGKKTIASLVCPHCDTLYCAQHGTTCACDADD